MERRDKGNRMMKMKIVMMIPQNPKRFQHLCGSMSQGLGEGNGVEL
jgi:hypothetical protein